MQLKVVPQTLGQACPALTSKRYQVDIRVFGDELLENLDGSLPAESWGFLSRRAGHPGPLSSVATSFPRLFIKSY